jgi:hypothetical protein
MTPINVEFSIPIKRKREEIFSFISNFSNHKRMYQANTDSRQTSEGPVGIGTTMRNIAKFLWIEMEEHFVVCQFEHNKCIGKKSLPGSTFVTTDCITLEDCPEGTIVKFHVYAEVKGILKLMSGMVEKKLKSAVEKDWKYIKENFESGNFR